jgi:hypothetical protein
MNFSLNYIERSTILKDLLICEIECADIRLQEEMENAQRMVWLETQVKFYKLRDKIEHLIYSKEKKILNLSLDELKTLLCLESQIELDWQTAIQSPTETTDPKVLRTAIQSYHRALIGYQILAELRQLYINHFNQEQERIQKQQEQYAKDSLKE